MPNPIQVHVGNLLDVDQGIIIHGCNALGLMGAGVALGIREKWTQAYLDYVATHMMEGLKLGQCIPVHIEPGLWVVNAITQADIGTHKRQVDYDAVREVFTKTARLARARNLALHFPLIGCGLAGGDWNVVEAFIEEVAPDIEKHLWVRSLDDLAKARGPKEPEQAIMAL